MDQSHNNPYINKASLEASFAQIEKRKSHTKKMQTLTTTTIADIKQSFADIYSMCHTQTNTHHIIHKLVYIQSQLVDAFRQYYINQGKDRLDEHLLYQVCKQWYKPLRKHFASDAYYHHIFDHNAEKLAKNSVLDAFIEALMVAGLHEHHDIEILPHSLWMDQYYHTDIAIYHAWSQSLYLIDVKSSSDHPPLTLSPYTDRTNTLAHVLQRRNPHIVIQHTHHITANPFFGLEGWYNIHSNNIQQKQEKEASILRSVHHMVERLLDHMTKP